MKKRWLLVPALAGAMVLTGCSSLNHGTITGKEYRSPYVWMMPMSIGKTIIFLPEQEPAHWVLDLKSGKQTGSVDVDQPTWDRARIGQAYNAGGK